jgi:hypothetical protein
MASYSTRRTSRGAVRHIVRVRLTGFRQLVRSFERKTDAREWAQRTEAQLREGRDFPSRQRVQRTLRDLIERYRAEAMPASCAGSYGAHLTWWQERLGDQRLSAVRPETIAAHSGESGHPFRSKAATLSERSDDQGSSLIEVAALATGSTSVACHDRRRSGGPSSPWLCVAVEIP